MNSENYCDEERENYFYMRAYTNIFWLEYFEIINAEHN